MARALVVVALAALFTACPGGKEKGKEMMQSARESHKDAINDLGGAPKAQIDHTAGRVQGQYEQGGARLEEAFKTE